MNNRIGRAVIVALALGAVFPGIWIWVRGAGLSQASFAGGPSPTLLSMQQLLVPRMPGLFLATLRAYALAVILAGGLAMLLTVRSGQVKAAILLSSALGGLAFFTAHLAISRSLPELTENPLLGALDYVSIAGFFFGAWSVLRTAHHYPQQVDMEAVMEYTRPAWERGIRDRVTPAGQRPSWLQRYLAWNSVIDARFALFIQSGRIPVWLTIVAGIFLALWQLNYRGTWVWMGRFVPFACAIMNLPLAWGVLDFQYRIGSKEDRTRISWLALGLIICGWLGLIAFGGGMLWLLRGGSEQAASVLVVLTALLPPLFAIIFILLLAVSIFFRGAVDPRLAIRKTSLYGVVALGITMAVAATQGAAVTQLAGRLGLPAQSGSVVSAVAVAVVLAPLRRRIETRMERAVDRILPASTLAESAREQVTVVFADLSGYTELSARDEPTALTLASLLHKESRRWAERHSGRVVKTIGDAVLFAFAEPGPAATLCADLNEKFAQAAGALKLPALPLHFGMHAGEVVRDREGDIFGGTVNLAARLQGQAGAGELVVSEAVASPLRLAGFTLEPLGEKKLKNVPAPVVCFRVRLA